MESQDDDVRERVPLRVLATALSYIERALRQLERAQEAYRADEALQDRVGVSSGDAMTHELVESFKDFYDAFVFAIISARSAVLALELLDRRGVNLPLITQSKAIVALRDIEEHWNEWRLAESAAHGGPEKPWMATRSAGRRWAESTGDITPDGWRSELAVAGDGLWTIVWWSGIDIARLTEELLALRATLSPLELEAFEYEYLDEATGEALVGSDWARIRRVVSSEPMRDDVIRWRRLEVLAQAHAVADRTERISGR